ncbi:hypothetical protein L1987_48395 [Smallanthus sonchifolius]|uniref:Uncharacterized protein n=1 Tax=Smallanthus sonchifolius TaxID=185202 RepID=A0ACB9FSA9_9ASTR|nr:hypothetical protein L1987_48395 [Smallanthus sonchifolius]
MPSATHIGESLTQGEFGVGSGEGDKGKGKQVVDIEVGDDVIVEEGDKNEKLECLIDLDDDIFIDDWVSFEFDASFVNQVNELEEVEIVGEACDIGENVEVPTDTWAERRKN